MAFLLWKLPIFVPIYAGERPFRAWGGWEGGPPSSADSVHFAPGEGGRVWHCDPPLAAPKLSISWEGQPSLQGSVASISG